MQRIVSKIAKLLLTKSKFLEGITVKGLGWKEKEGALRKNSVTLTEAVTQTANHNR